MSDAYRAAGVDIDAGERAVQRIMPLVRSTYRPEVVGDLGGFGGLFALDRHGRADPILVSATDGVGTKAVVATQTGRFDTIGLDLVAMCVDDLVCIGAEPLFFLDYLSIGVLDPDHIEAIVAGIAEGCRQAGCALIGGEMAEHPGLMARGEFDPVGFAVGIVDRSAAIDGSTVTAGQVLVGLASPGLRSNGYSLARKVLLDDAGLGFDDPAWEGAATTVADELMTPSVIYSPTVLAIIDATPVAAIAHITGGGLPGNIDRVLPADVDALVDLGAWESPPIFSRIGELGGLDRAALAEVFNLGIGMVLVVDPAELDTVVGVAAERGISALPIGETRPGTGTVHLG